MCPAVAAAMASDDDVFDTLWNGDAFYLCTDVIGADARHGDVGGCKFGFVWKEDRDAVHHVITTCIRMLDGDVKKPQAIGLRGFDHQDFDLVREGG